MIIVSVLVAALVAYELWLKQRLKKRWLQIFISVIVAAILSPAVFHAITTYTNRDREESERNFENAVLKVLHNQETDYKEFEELIRLKYKEVFLNSEQEADQWAEDFLSKLSQMRADQIALQDETQTLVGKLELRWGPLYKYLLNGFDKRTNEMAKRFEKIAVESRDVSLVASNQPNRSQLDIRKVAFPNNNHLKVELHTGVVENGKVTMYPLLAFEESLNGHKSTVFMIRYSDDAYELILGHPRHRGFFHHHIRLKSDPLENEEFLTNVNKALNRAFESVLL